MNRKAFVRAVLPVAFSKPTAAAFVEAEIGQAIYAKTVKEVRGRNETPGKTPLRVVWAEAAEMRPSEATLTLVWAEVAMGDTTIKKIAKRCNLPSGLVFKAITELRARGEVRRSTITGADGKRSQVWKLDLPQRGVSAPHAAEHEKGSPVTFSQGGVSLVQQAPVAFPAAGATEV